MCDNDRDGFINRKEFGAFYKILTDCKENDNNDAFTMALFKFADTDHDGLINEKELIELHRQMGW